MTLSARNEKAETESRKKKRLLDPDAQRVNMADAGGEYGGQHPEPDEGGPDIVHHGMYTPAPGQTTHS